MKKNPKQIAAIVGLVAIAALIIAFIVSAFTTTADSRNLFFALLPFQFLPGSLFCAMDE